MNIEETIYVCPKCKKEYTNARLLSCWGGMADAARSFIKNNKITTHCEVCGTRVVKEDNIIFFNKNGEFDYKTNVVDFPKGNVFHFYIDLICQLQRVMSCFDRPQLSLEGILERVKKENVDEEKVRGGRENTSELISHIKIKVTADKEYVLYDIVLDKVDYADIGDRYNSFMIEYFLKTLKATLVFLTSALKKDTKEKIKSTLTADFDKKLMTYFC